MYLSVTTIKAWLRELAAIVGLVVSAGNLAHWPGSLRATVAAGASYFLTQVHLSESSSSSGPTSGVGK